MVQRRVVDYGALADASDIKKVIEGLARSSVLIGFRFGVSGVNKMRIFPGTAVTNQGVMIIEDEIVELEVPNTTTSQQYTVYYQHQDEDISGGVPADLKLGSGFLNPEDVDGVVLGYVDYPGDAIPLNATMFTQEPETYLRNFIPNRNNADWLVPIRNQGYMVTSTSGSALTLTDTWDAVNSQMFLKMQNNVSSASNATAVITFPFKVRSFPYALLQLRMQIDLAVTVEFLMIDTDGNEFNITEIPLAASADFSLYQYQIPKEAKQDPNRIIYIQMIVNAAYTRVIKLQGIGLSEYNLPL